MITVDDIELMDVCVLDGYANGPAICLEIGDDEKPYEFKDSGTRIKASKEDLYCWLVGIQGKGGNKNYNSCYRRDHEPNADHKFLAENI
jgi:hypothetical protein